MILEVRGVSKEFSGVKALDSVDFSVQSGEIHCLVGENGAGKSTLMNIISGVYPHNSYSGHIRFNGKKLRYKEIKDSERDGIVIIHQELALSPYMSIYENIFLGHEISKRGRVDWNQTIAETHKLLGHVELKENPETVVNTLGVGKQQLVEIAKAISKNVRLLILDEPTSSLNDSESAHLLNLILEFKKKGMTCIMISHKLNEVMKIADTITILRDGKTVSSFPNSPQVTEEQVIGGMVGRDLSHRYPERRHEPGDTCFEVKNWLVYHPDFSDRRVIDNASFYVRRGEIIGLCGLMGSGRTELARSIFGKHYGIRHSGQIIHKNKRRNYNSPKEAIADGLMYLSEDRKEYGLILIQDIKSNISISALDKISKAGIVDGQKEIRNGEFYKDKIAIKATSVDQTVESLSGGNQQKVLLSRCLFTNPEVLIIDEPTRGIDVGAKYEIYCILNDFVAQGKSVIMITSELPEAIGMSDRIYVMNEGRIKGELSRNEFSQEKIMQIAISQDEI